MAAAVRSGHHGLGGVPSSHAGLQPSFQNNLEIATVVPFVYSHGALVSPGRLGRFNQNKQIPPTVSGIFRYKGYGVNSATLMRVGALREIGGYSEEFWLDLSDVYAFQAMYRKGRYMFIAGDLTCNTP